MAGVAWNALDEVVSVRFGEEDLRRIRALAVIYDRTPSAVIREACGFYLSQQAGVPEEPAGSGACGSAAPGQEPS
jgi:hypothetical protein